MIKLNTTLSSTLVATVLVAVLGLFVQSSIAMPASNSPEQQNEVKKFSPGIRIGYVPHNAFLVDNGIASGALAPLMECAIGYFENVQFIEMPSYDRMMMSLEHNVVDMGLNMVRTPKRDQIAKYAIDLYNSRILLVTSKDDVMGSNESLGVIGVRRGTEFISLLEVKGFDIDMKVKSLDHLFSMFQNNYIDTFAEAEITIIDRLLSYDEANVDYDYRVISERSGGAYLALDFANKYNNVSTAWQSYANSCAYLAPSLDG